MDTPMERRKEKKKIMKNLNEYKLNKYNEINYIKKFVNGVTKEELKEMFRKHLLEGFLTILIGTQLLNHNEKLKSKT